MSTKDQTPTQMPDAPGATAGLDAAEAPRAQDAAKRGAGVCRTCLAQIWWETGEVGHREAVGWSDRVKRGGDSLVCFSAVDYRHVPLEGREAAIFDHAYRRGSQAPIDVAAPAGESRSGGADVLEKVALLHSETHRTVAYPEGRPVYTVRCRECGQEAPCPTSRTVSPSKKKRSSR